jgi:hypothetical protein
MINEITKLANALDKMGYHKEADQLDALIRKMSAFTWTPPDHMVKRISPEELRELCLNDPDNELCTHEKIQEYGEEYRDTHTPPPMRTSDDVFLMAKWCKEHPEHSACEEF